MRGKSDGLGNRCPSHTYSSRTWSAENSGVEDETSCKPRTCSKLNQLLHDFRNPVMSCESATASGGGAAGPDWRGVASALIYQPGNHAKTDELIALAQVAAKYKGIYISHIRNEGDHEMEAIDELITIARKAGVPSEIYHLKVAGEKNWKNLPEVIQKVGITEGSLWRSNHEAEEQPRKLWPFCGQSSQQRPLMATIYCISETTLRVSQRKRYDLFSFGYTAAALAAGSRFSDSQSSDPRMLAEEEQQASKEETRISQEAFASNTSRH